MLPLYLGDSPLNQGEALKVRSDPIQVLERPRESVVSGQENCGIDRVETPIAAMAITACCSEISPVRLFSVLRADRRR